FCPFNSQNTIFWKEAFPLLYLPAYVSFRMTDIWRSFVAEVCLYAMGKNLAFREATVFQERNQHSLIKDFRDEVPGYLNNVRIVETLTALRLGSDLGEAGNNVWKCYDALVRAEIVPSKEMPLLELWLGELASL
ncbi:MAG: STELLO glycosyltransferase family protein, partial [Acidobacteriota bacterium]|nr:STELLO glycosyltransferase family protein [Acidobacteriota bacterium]